MSFKRADSRYASGENGMAEWDIGGYERERGIGWGGSG